MKTIQSHILLNEVNEMDLRSVGCTWGGHDTIWPVTSTTAARGSYNWLGVILVHLNLPDSLGFESLIATRWLVTAQPSHFLCWRLINTSGMLEYYTGVGSSPPVMERQNVLDAEVKAIYAIFTDINFKSASKIEFSRKWVTSM